MSLNVIRTDPEKGRVGNLGKIYLTKTSLVISVMFLLNYKEKKSPKKYKQLFVVEYQIPLVQ